MSSEAAQKAYPDVERGDDERYDDFEMRETVVGYSRDAFDRGAVEALRQAAAQVRYELGREASGHTSTYSVRNWLMKFADEWVVGQ